MLLFFNHVARQMFFNLLLDVLHVCLTARVWPALEVFVCKFRFQAQIHFDKFLHTAWFRNIPECLYRLQKKPWNSRGRVEPRMCSSLASRSLVTFVPPPLPLYLESVLERAKLPHTSEPHHQVRAEGP